MSQVQMEALQRPWSAPVRAIFRFIFCYLSLYSLYLSSDIHQRLIWFAGSDGDGFIDPLTHRFVPWIGKHILHLQSEITVFSNGSGDTTYDNVLVLSELSIALVAALIWSRLDRKRLEYNRLHEWLRLAVRIVLGLELLVYGIDKLIPVQFGTLSPDRLDMRFGEASPMGLLWTFMSASRPYTMFGGAAEVLGGILILLPRLTTLGALISTGVMTNVFALNLSYDVPVKLLSLHLLLLSIFLAAPDLRRLIDLLVLNRPTAPRLAVALSDRAWINRAALIVPLIIGALFLIDGVRFMLKRYATQNASAESTPLSGSWSVEQLDFDGAPAPLLTEKLLREYHTASGEDRWKSLQFQGGTTLVITLGNSVRDIVDVHFEGSRLHIADSADADWKCDLGWQLAGDKTLKLQGTISGTPVTLKLARVTVMDNLSKRGFHWISEHPF